MAQPVHRRMRTITRAAISVAVVVLALLIFKLLIATKPMVPTTDPGLARPRVEVFIARRAAVRRQWRGFGAAEAIDSANVPARITATVRHIPEKVLEGAPVKKGQVLVELDDSDYRDQLQIARQNLAAADARLEQLDTEQRLLTQRLEIESQDLQLAQDELSRIEDLFEKKAANQKDVDAASRAVLAVRRTHLLISETLDRLASRRLAQLAERAGLQASVNLAELNLGRCSITSPIDGGIQFIDVEVGENLEPGQRVARVVNQSRIQVPLQLPAGARPDIHPGDPVELASTGSHDAHWTGNVARIAPEDDTSNRTFAVYVELNQANALTGSNPGGSAELLAPGAFVSGTVTAKDASPLMVVPRRSIRTGRITLVIDGLIHSRPVEEAFALQGEVPELDLPDDQWSVLTGGLNEGEQVVLNPARSLRDGKAVRPSVTGNHKTAVQPRVQEADP